MVPREVPKKRHRILVHKKQKRLERRGRRWAGEEGRRRDLSAEVVTEGAEPLLGERRTVPWNYEPVCNLFQLFLCKICTVSLSDY